ncbi:hypothetical protein TNCT_564721 [Trichonephila clavata]|uniref:Uncharacterized protein n=1 Tax=Trichonephila clavata TaxID=2740835 RepID=A0A8X6J8F4_TRICU|nr:hypothetical protein TNCT_564721 [Trichonephila clavata]
MRRFGPAFTIGSEPESLIRVVKLHGNNGTRIGVHLTGVSMKHSLLIFDQKEKAIFWGLKKDFITFICIHEKGRGEYHILMRVLVLLVWIGLSESMYCVWQFDPSDETVVPEIVKPPEESVKEDSSSDNKK